LRSEQVAAVDGVDLHVREGEAERTGGQFYDAPSAAQLEKVYDDIGSKIGLRKERKDATHWPLGAGVALLIVAAGLSLAWQQKLP